MDEYLNKKSEIEESDKFCDLYMEIFYTKSDDLEKGLPQKLFEILDDINLICDSYEKIQILEKRINFVLTKYS